MCFELDSSPPIPFISGAAFFHEDLELEAADGNRFAASAALPAAELEAPILALMGGADQAITADEIADFDAALTAAGVEHEVVTYDGAPRSFFDRKHDEFAEASADAWRRALDFVERHSGRH